MGAVTDVARNIEGSKKCRLLAFLTPLRRPKVNTASNSQGAQSASGASRSDRSQAFVYLATILGMRLVPGITAEASYVALAVYALLGRANAIRALAMSWLLSMGNTGLLPDANLASIGRYGIIAGAGASALLHSGLLSRYPRIAPLTGFTACLGAFLIFHSLFFSRIVDVSLLKSLTWAIAVTTLMSCWTGLGYVERRRLEQEVFFALVFVLLASLPLLVLPVGFLRNGTGFQGILNQPQAFGPTMALLGAWTLARMLAQERPSWRHVALLGLCGAMVLLSLARTAGLTLVLGVGLSMLLIVPLSGRPFAAMVPGLRSSRLWALAGMALIAGLFMLPTILNVIQGFVLKSRSGIDGLLDLYLDTRGMLVLPMLDNIAEHPWTRIGFGIASQPDLMVVDRDSVLGLPTGAAIEKGLAYLAVLEELGIFGALFVAAWLWRVLRASGRNGLVSLTLCLSVLVTNISESTLFSPGGMGLLFLIVLTAAGTGSVTEAERV